jgi:hypothetical protein
VVDCGGVGTVLVLAELVVTDRGGAGTVVAAPTNATT